MALHPEPVPNTTELEERGRHDDVPSTHAAAASAWCFLLFVGQPQCRVLTCISVSATPQEPKRALGTRLPQTTCYLCVHLSIYAYLTFMIMEAFSHQRVCPFWFWLRPNLHYLVTISHYLVTISNYLVTIFTIRSQFRIIWSHFFRDRHFSGKKSACGMHQSS